MAETFEKVKNLPNGKVSVLCQPHSAGVSFEFPEEVRVTVNPEDLDYHLEPIHCGPNVVSLNAKDPKFYKRRVENPILTVWCLSRSDSMGGWVKKRLFEEAYNRRIHFQVLETHKFELFATKDGLDVILYEGKPIELPDCIIVRVGATVDYFGVAVIRQLEKLGVVVLNPSQSIEISSDKLYTMQHLAAHGLPIPYTLLAKFPLDLEVIEKHFEYPVIVKKASGSQGKGIMKIDCHDQLEDIVDMLDTKDPLIFQEFIEHSKGRDLRVFVAGGKVISAMMRIASKGFKANVHQGGTVKSVKINPMVEWLVLEVVRLIGLDIAGVDLLIDKSTYKVCEVNSSPGFEGLERATGINVAAQIMDYVKLRMGVWRVQRKGGRKINLVVPIQADHEDEEKEAAAALEAGGGGGGAADAEPSAHYSPTSLMSEDTH